ncbi:transcription initiation factor IIE subunit alpha-like [Chenopodium quinoa]|uniref:transcription initiation factor IIE subunit alpha-like n=1 Tax=Chenopodium quinoa TaxID=63459 RepID=UPI000B7773AA|nr:transcription initiation factor IIE subunit alpha-like [Chenopodium quinoa]
MAELTPNEESTSSEEAYKVFVNLLGKAFYEDVGVDGRVDPREPVKLKKVLDHFGENPQWMSMTEISRSVKISRTYLRRALRYLEEEKLVQCGQYRRYSLNYAGICEAVNYKILQKQETFENKRSGIAEYICLRCDRKYNALDAASLISEDGNTFVCENCEEEVITEKESQKKMEAQLKLLQDQLEIVKDIPIPVRFVNGTQLSWKTEPERGEGIPRSGFGAQLGHT